MSALRALPRGLCLLVLGGVLCELLGCGTPRAVDNGGQCLSWREELGPLLHQRCGSCHSGARPMGGYDVGSYLTAIGAAGGLPWAVAGAEYSPLIQVLQNPDSTHAPLRDVLPTVRSWVVDCRLAFFRSAVHSGGVLNPAEPQQFHGALLRDTGWNFAACTVCHGSDFKGGQSQVSCLTCHAAGPTTCDTCHGRQLGAAHQAHRLGLTQGKMFSCSECHPTPVDYRDPGHLYEADGSARTAAVRVSFGRLAGLSAPMGVRLGPPSFLADSQTCENIYCHGAPFSDTKATHTRPSWVNDPRQVACGACHGLPPQSHAATAQLCVLCHNRTVTADGKLRPGGLHLNGHVDVGDGSGTCYACHGTAASLAPPTDLLGNTAVTAIGVGVHQSHLQASNRLRGPIPCSDCHLVPDRVDSPNHIGTVLMAAVFPDSPSFISLAKADGAQPQWDHATATCSNVYCHGGGQKLGTDLAPMLLRKPRWTQPGQAACGTCHGIPPRDGNHTSAMRLIDCTTCHPATMDATGTLRVSGVPGAETSAHINGVVDVR